MCIDVLVPQDLEVQSQFGDIGKPLPVHLYLRVSACSCIRTRTSQLNLLLLPDA